ncbi:MAG: Ig-like domain-containing protein [Bacteroides sp.]|nr:Ig-like domain-containing protein [Eubacterium sp.]MCM1418366.1 Ig-like domain-containing protein [Roseburia sp.]MCM1462466.1 Ig-like domain-containing protein [Bacteroides sp.]
MKTKTRLKIMAACTAFLLALTDLFGFAELLPGVSGFSATAEAASKMLNHSSMTITVGQKVKLKANTDKTVKWSSSDKSIATVNSKGTVTGKKYGEVKIYATVDGKKYTCKISVEKLWINDPVSGYNFSGLEVGDVVYLEKNLTSSAEWYSSNPYVATVNKNGKVTARKEGMACIYAKVGNETAHCFLCTAKGASEKVPYYVETVMPDMYLGINDKVGLRLERDYQFLNVDKIGTNASEARTQVCLDSYDKIQVEGDNTLYGFDFVALANLIYPETSYICQKGDRYGKFTITESQTNYIDKNANIKNSDPDYVITEK